MFAWPFATTLRLGNTVPFEEKLQRWRAIGKSVFDLTGPGFELLTFRTKAKSTLPHRLCGRWKSYLTDIFRGCP